MTDWSCAGAAKLDRASGDKSAAFGKACGGCHGPGGLGDGPFATKDPSPANLTDAEWTYGSSDGEIFWVIKNGIKMTGMPSFGAEDPPVPDREIWNMVAFLKKLSSVSDEDFKAGSAAPPAAAATR